MEIRLRSNGAVMTETTFRQEFRDRVIPFPLTEQWLNDFGADPVFEGPQATTTPPYQFSYRNGVEQQDGKWFSKYSVGPVFTDTPEATAAQQMTAYRAQKDAEQAAAVRADRTKRISETDWTQLPDAPLTTAQKAAWATYRQSLRDIPAQAGFPWTLTWPTSP